MVRISLLSAKNPEALILQCFRALGKSTRRRRTSGGRPLCADRSGDLEPSSPGGARKHKKDILPDVFLCFYRARDGTRTRGPDLGKVVLHQLSHSCIYSSVPDGQVILYLMVLILSTTIFKVFQKIEKNY